MAQNCYLLRYILVGDSNTGKTTLLQTFLQREDQSSAPTLSVEFASKLIKVRQHTVKLQIWDTAGQEAYRSIIRAYYRNTKVALLVYDCTSRKSFQSLVHWLQQLKSQLENGQTIILVSNKVDLTDQLEVSSQEGAAFALQNRLQFRQVSAKTGLNVDQLFSETAEALVEQFSRGTQQQCTGLRCGSLSQSRKRKTLTSKKQPKKCCS